MRAVRPVLLACGAVALIVAGLVIVVGRGTDEPDGGRYTAVMAEFVTSCGQCHALQHAETKPAPTFPSPAATASNVGPDLDQLRPNAALTEHAIQQGRDQGMGRMPARIVTPAEAVRIAGYIEDVVQPEPPVPAPTVRAQLSGMRIFQDGNGSATACGACHTLSAAKSAATTGPDLDEVLRGQSASDITRSIVDPQERVSPGYQGGIMPSDYGDQLGADEFQRLIAFLMKSTRGSVDQ